MGVLYLPISSYEEFLFLNSAFISTTTSNACSARDTRMGNTAPTLEDNTPAREKTNKPINSASGINAKMVLASQRGPEES